MSVGITFIYSGRPYTYSPKISVHIVWRPYNLYDFPYLKTYINAFSFADESQLSVANVIMGKLKAQGKNPIAFKGFLKEKFNF